jgi:hypothetical protein
MMPAAAPSAAPGRPTLEAPLLPLPQVLREARAALGCPTLTGVPLEDEGGIGTAGSHWEFRLFQVCVCVCVERGGGITHFSFRAWIGCQQR